MGGGNANRWLRNPGVGVGKLAQEKTCYFQVASCKLQHNLCWSDALYSRFLFLYQVVLRVVVAKATCPQDHSNGLHMAKAQNSRWLFVLNLLRTWLLHLNILASKPRQWIDSNESAIEIRKVQAKQSKSFTQRNTCKTFNWWLNASFPMTTKTNSKVQFGLISATNWTTLLDQTFSLFPSFCSIFVLLTREKICFVIYDNNCLVCRPFTTKQTIASILDTTTSLTNCNQDRKSHYGLMIHRGSFSCNRHIQWANNIIN